MNIVKSVARTKRGALTEDALFRWGIITALHTHEEGVLSPDCPGCLEEAVRR